MLDGRALVVKVELTDRETVELVERLICVLLLLERELVDDTLLSLLEKELVVETLLSLLERELVDGTLLEREFDDVELLLDNVSLVVEDGVDVVPLLLSLEIELVVEGTVLSLFDREPDDEKMELELEDASLVADVTVTVVSLLVTDEVTDEAEENVSLLVLELGDELEDDALLLTVDVEDRVDDGSLLVLLDGLEEVNEDRETVS